MLIKERNPSFELVTTRLGALSIKNLNSGEILHNPLGPLQEARELYVQYSNFREKISIDLESDLVLFDVGLGAAANSLAALECWRQAKTRRPLRIISFENDLSLLSFALENAKYFPHLEKEVLRSLLKSGSYQEPSLIWEIRLGNFPEKVFQENHAPEVIFFDLYSPSRNEEVWRHEIFSRLAQLGQGAPTPCTLVTYTRSTGIRASLLLAGFYVGAISGLVPEMEATQGCLDLNSLKAPLTASWLNRWRSSQSPIPPGLASRPLEDIEGALSTHLQFANLKN